ncbi:MAG: hypothetical protein AB4368_23655 [Xenococcaceae cyanobacterium]
MKEIIVYIQVADESNSPEATDTLPEIQIIIDNEHPSRNRTIGIESLISAIIAAVENLESGISEDVFLKVRLGRAVELNSPGSSQRRRRTTTTRQEGGAL